MTAQTRDFRALQRHLGPRAGGGVDAEAAWRVGARGGGVRVADIEGAWRLDHECLRMEGCRPDEVPLGDTQRWLDHGTSVLATLAARGDVGVVGVAPDAEVVLVPLRYRGMGVGDVVRHATRLLRAGDVLLIEVTRAGPEVGFVDRPGSEGHIPIEWWPDDFDAIRAAVEAGVVVVEPAGNGQRDLDAEVYDVPQGVGLFPDDWDNSFREGGRDSGAIIVGAGLPGAALGEGYVDASRCARSNYGSRVDVQGWGEAVVTAGGGDLVGGPDGAPPTRWYTHSFGGTSAAAAMIAGVACCLQSYAAKRLGRALTPRELRALLRDPALGTAQGDAPPGRPAAQRIGPRPDLSRILCAVDERSASGRWSQR